MQAIILAAGRGTRMGSLTNTVPKPMLMVNGKNLIQHKIDALPEEVSEVIIVVGYLGEVIRTFFGDAYNGKRMTYIEQRELSGTAHAVACVKPYINGRFLILMGDDIYGSEELAQLIRSKGWAILVQETSDLRGTGNMHVVDGMVLDITYGDVKINGGVMNTNAMLLDERYFDGPYIPKSPGSLEYGLPHSVVHQSVSKRIPLEAVFATTWIQITAPEDLKSAEALLNEAQ